MKAIRFMIAETILYTVFFFLIFTRQKHFAYKNTSK